MFSARFRRTVALAAFIGAPMAAVPASVAGAAEPAPATFSANIVARHSNKCLDVSNASMQDAANVVQYRCNGGKNQEWNLVATSGGFYTIRAAHSNKCLDVFGQSSADAANTVQFACNSGTNQEWRLVQRDSGYFSIVARHSNKCLDVFARSQEDNANVVQYTCNNGPNQQWRLA